MKSLTILGGGPAGLSVGYFAKQANLSFQIFEANECFGGNCITHSRKIAGEEFRYDSGAHRFHDKIPAITQLVQSWLGQDLMKVHAPSQIYLEGQYIDFPLSPFNLLKYLGFRQFLKATFEILKNRIQQDSNATYGNFEDLSVARYGELVAETFLLQYSRKLWGVPTKELIPDVSGNRLKGLSLKSFIVEGLLGQKKKNQHLDGSFYYPKQGYGMIVDKMTALCGKENLQANSRITQLITESNLITHIEINKSDKLIPVRRVVSTLPLNLVLKILNPQPPTEILEAAQSLQFRHLVLMAIFLNKPTISNNATIYFPSPDVPFTRIVESRNRSPFLAPEGKTTIVVEIPVFQDDPLWSMSEKAVFQFVAKHLAKLGICSISDILGADLKRMPNAYPVLKVGMEEKVNLILEYLKQFENLHLFGRNGLFKYNHLHNLIAEGKKFIQSQMSDNLKLSDI